MTTTTSSFTREEELLNKLDGQIRNVLDYMASGKCEDFETYRYTAGKLEGMRDIRTQLVEFFAEADNDE